MSEHWLKKAETMGDFALLTGYDLFWNVFYGDIIMVVNGYDCSLRNFDTYILSFAKLMFYQTHRLNRGEDIILPYSVDSDEKIWLSRSGNIVTLTSTFGKGVGLCDYRELTAASVDFAKKVLTDFLTIYPRAVKNVELREGFIVPGLDTAHIFEQAEQSQP